MKRHGRTWFLAASGALGTIGAIRFPAKAAQYEYKLATNDPVDYPPGVRMTQMAEAVKAETKGRLEIKVYPNSMLGSQSSLLTQLRIGSIQFLITNHGTYTGLVPVAAIDSVGFAFTSNKQATDALDGALGAYVRKEFAAKNVYCFEKTFDTGFRQITSGTHPIRTADDFNGFKLRSLPANIFVDLFKTLGASTIAIDSNEQYVAMQTHLVDGADGPYPAIESYKLYEVQKYLSNTNHIWGGYWLTSNMEAWNALPPDIREIVERQAAKYILLERLDARALQVSLSDKLVRQGMIANKAETGSMRAKLAPYYARWKNELGATAWGLLEASVGKLA